jgi:hypothetical protein
MVGETRAQEGGSDRPAWVERGVWVDGNAVLVTGLATGRTDRGEARRAAEDDARRRLAATFETRVVAASDDATRVSGSVGPDGTSSARLDVESSQQIRTFVDEVLHDAKLIDEHVESHERFDAGWQRLWDCWVCVSMPRDLYERQLVLARQRLGAGRG